MAKKPCDVCHSITYRKMRKSIEDLDVCAGCYSSISDILYRRHKGDSHPIDKAYWILVEEALVKARRGK